MDNTSQLCFIAILTIILKILMLELTCRKEKHSSVSMYIALQKQLFPLLYLAFCSHKTSRKYFQNIICNNEKCSLLCFNLKWWDMKENIIPKLGNISILLHNRHKGREKVTSSLSSCWHGVFCWYQRLPIEHFVADKWKIIAL